MTRNLYRDSLIPPYMAYPRFLLDMDIMLSSGDCGNRWRKSLRR